MTRRTAARTLLLCALLAAPSSAFAGEPGAHEGTAHEGEPHGTAPHAEEEAAEGRLPLAAAERPLTLPRMVLSPELDVDLTHVANDGSYVNATLLASFGITDDFTVRAAVAPLQLTGANGQGFHYGQSTENLGPSVGATYRFVRGHVEVGASLDLGLPTLANTSGVFFTPAVPVRIHIGKKLRLDTGVAVPIASITRSATVVVPSLGPVSQSHTTTTEGINIPFSALYDITEPIHVGAATAFSIGDVNDVSHSTLIPFTVFAGYALGGKDGPILDIDPFFQLPFALTPGASSATQTGSFVVGVNLGGFLYL